MIPTCGDQGFLQLSRPSAGDLFSKNEMCNKARSLPTFQQPGDVALLVSLGGLASPVEQCPSCPVLSPPVLRNFTRARVSLAQAV